MCVCVCMYSSMYALRDELCTAKAPLHAWRLGPKKKVKAARRAGWVRWKGRRKRLPKSPFSASLSQVHRYIWFASFTAELAEGIIAQRLYI